jgi:gamma-glutamyl-gamma-aminobutyrate hydrolase PuuD
VKVKDIVEEIDGVEFLVKGDIEKEVNGCYVSDLLSAVLANSGEGDVWITHQTHPNVVAVASVRELSGVIITGNRDVDPETVKKAEAERVTILKCGLSKFEIVGLVYTLFKSRGKI